MRTPFLSAIVAVLLTAGAQAERLGYHEIKIEAFCQIVPWSSTEPVLDTTGSEERLLEIRHSQSKDVVVLRKWDR